MEFMNDLFSQLQPIIMSAAVTILTALATAIGVFVKNKVKELANTKEKKDVVETTCRYINQVFKDLNGAEKFEKAKENILQQLNEKGISISDLELEVLIEATVNGFKDGITPVQYFGESVLLDETTNDKN